MAVDIIQDCRNTAQRTSVLETPFWVSSGLVDAAASAAIDDKVILLFSFPKADQKVLILNFCAEVITAFTAGTAGIVGFYTLATDIITTGGVATIVSTGNQLEHTTDTTYTSAALYFPSANTVQMAAHVLGFPVAAENLITGAASTVYCVCATFANAGTIIAGKVRYHMMITVIPTANQ